MAEIKKIDIKSLKDRAKKVQSEILSLTLDKSMSKLSNLRVIKSKRRDLAQMLTVLKQKQLLEVLEKPKEVKENA
ncbi:MAG: 50S ribosomal protein L29 [Patescibacteria group bacterium]|nr:50S ribosomal protein L29 [Patescibacteria group bacterium]